MLILILGLLIFFAIHLLPTQVEMRDGLARRFGRMPYMAAFSMISAIGLALIIVGYAKLKGGPAGKNPDLWYPPLWAHHITLLLMIPAMVLLAAAYIPSRIRTAARHPMLIAIKLWAVGHLLANGDLASILLFGSFLAYAVYDRISVKYRSAPGPLGDRAGTITGDATVVIAGLGLYAVLVFFLHEHLFGVAPSPALAL